MLTVPFSLEPGPAREHFPHLHEFAIETRAGRRVLVNTRRDGTRESFDDLSFHGGQGDTLEMRVFTRDALQQDLAQAGFAPVSFEQAAVPRFGIFWRDPWSVPVVAKRPEVRP